MASSPDSAAAAAAAAAAASFSYNIPQFHSTLDKSTSAQQASNPTVAISTTMAVPPGSVSSAPMTQRPITPMHSANPLLQQQNYHAYPSLPPMAAAPLGPWSGMPRAPLLPYPPGPFPLPPYGVSRPAFLSPNLQLHAAGASGASHHLIAMPGMHKDLPPPGIDNNTHIHDFSTKDNNFITHTLDAWTAHKTDAGVVYYYNALTRVSTYEKPPGFNAESEKVPMQSTPVSIENLAGIDWALITTNDGRKYYYNNRTKLSSWQIPSEVTELKKKQEVSLKEQEVSVPHFSVSNEKGSVPISLNTPAIISGRDATTLRASCAPGASSALDLIKRKLQDSGTPVASSTAPHSSGIATIESNGSKAMEFTAKGLQNENSKEKLKDGNGDVNASDSSSDSDEEDNGPTKEECNIQFKEMLKERGIAPFAKWKEELPKIVFDPRFKAIPSHSARRYLFENYVKTRAEEERKEKRAVQKAAIEGFRQLLEEASVDIDHNTDYQRFRKKWSNDPRFGAVDRKDREHLLNERVFPLKTAAQEKVQAERAAAAASFKSMLRDKVDLTVNSRWSKVKESLRNDPRYKSVEHEEREVLYNEYLYELKAAEEEAEREAKVRREEQEKLKERERELRKRKEREEQEMERVREKLRRKEAIESFQALLVETIKDPQASWTESKTRLEKDPQGRGTNSYLDSSDTEKLFREHVKMLHERCIHEYKALLAEVINAEAASGKAEDSKTVLDSWSTAKRILKQDPRYNKMPRKEREMLWQRHAEDVLRKQKITAVDKHTDPKSRSSADSGRYLSGSKRAHDRR